MSESTFREQAMAYYGYQQWANRHILDAAATVPFEQLTTPVLTGFDPVRTTLVHMMWAQLHWLYRYKGLPRAAVIEPETLPDLGSIENRWAEIDAETTAYLASVTEEMLISPLPNAGSGGVPTRPLWQALLHQANHQTYHRGEVAAVLTHLGASPGELDFFRIYDRTD